MRIVVEGDKRMFNPYGVIAVNPAHIADTNYQGAMEFINWITSAEGQARIAAFRVGSQKVFFLSGKP